MRLGGDFNAILQEGYVADKTVSSISTLCLVNY
jgi:hypothetical protein